MMLQYETSIWGQISHNKIGHKDIQGNFKFYLSDEKNKDLCFGEA